MRIAGGGYPGGMSAPGIEHHTTTVNGVDLHHVTAGGGHVVLQHGFPEFRRA